MRHSSGRKPKIIPVARPLSSLTSLTADTLRELVLDGTLAPGQRLNEVELAAGLQTSRAPLREAIQRLISEGLLMAVNSRGAYVKSFTSVDLQEMYELRTILETHAARVAARSASTEDLEALKRELDEADATLASDEKAGYPSDRDFHERLLLLAGNDQISAVAIRLYGMIQLARLRSGHSADRAAEALREHREITDCLLERNGDAAARVVERHLGRALANALRLFDAQPPSDADSA